jgi:tRNA A-37 threonylcarbamoyl transferase component Bud32
LRIELVSPGKTEDYPFLLTAVNHDELGRLGSYRVLRLLGRGGMAYVFEAEDIALGRRVALKVMRPEMKEVDGWHRFLREARTMALIKHDHLVTIYQAGQDGETAWFAMELLQGETLYDWLHKAPKVEFAEVVRLARELAEGLEVLHGRGLVHRDIKPANIWLEGPKRRVKILDLGLVRVVEGDRLTEAGLAVGTPGFMSPEQARGLTLDARSDLFSLGCVLYELCTGREPFVGPTPTAALTALAVDTPRPVRELNPKTPPALAKLIGRLLEKVPQHRPASAEQVRAALEKIELDPAPGHSATQVVEASGPPRRRSRGPSPRASRRRQWLALAVSVALVFVAAVVLSAGLVARAQWKSTESAAKNAGPGQVYLTDMKPNATEYWPFRPPPNPDGSVNGDVICVAGKVSPHGLFMHPPPMLGAAAAVSYRLDGAYALFHADVTINDGPGSSESPCTFEVYADGKLIWRSSPVRSQADVQRCEVPVKGVNLLRIAVTCAGPPHGAHCVWFEPQLAR